MPIDWARAYNQLFEIIDLQDATYFSGPRFIRKIRELDPYFPNYYQYIDDRRRSGRSTTRQDYFYDIILGLEEPNRLQLFELILSDIEPLAPEKTGSLRAFLGGIAPGPVAVVPNNTWRANRLNACLAEIDESIVLGNYERAITLSYTCLEGFYKAFLRENAPEHAELNEIIALSREVKRWLGSVTTEAYPEEILNMVNHISHTIDRTRNRFSEAHFDEEADKWLAIYVRDLVNTQVRLLLQFI